MLSSIIICSGISSRSHRRRGFVFPLVVGVMFVLGIFFGALSLLSRGQVQSAVHYVDSTRALELAEAGAAWASTVLASGSYNPSPSFFSLDLLKAIFDPTPDETKEHVIEIPESLDEYRSSLDGTLKIIARVTKPRKFDPVEGFFSDPIEKYGEMQIISTASVGKSARRVRLTRGFKVFLAVHPVLSKFTLFVRESPPNDQINCLVRGSTSDTFENGAPLLLQNHEAPHNAVDSTIHIPELPPIPQLARDSGWVFLNSPSASWTLHLSGSSGDTGEYDDRVLLRFGQYGDPALKARVQGPPSNLYTLKDMMRRYQGLKAKFLVNTTSGPVEKPASAILGIRYLCGDTPKASLLRPFGTGSRLTPTLVFGPVFRTYIHYRLVQIDLMDTNTGNIIPFKPTVVPGFPNESSFADGINNPFVGDRSYAADIGIFCLVWGIEKNNFSASWAKYQPTSTELKTDPYLDSLNYLYLQSKESGTVSDPVPSSFSDPPPDIVTAIDQWEPSGGSLPDSLRAASGKINRGSVPVFEGQLGNIEGLKELQAKITVTFPTTADFASRCVRDGKLRIPGIVYISQGDLSLSTPLKVEAGGILIVNGNISLKAGIIASDPLTLISTKNISVETSSQIEARLVCLRGEFQARGGFTILGGVAARRLDMAGMLNGQPKSIVFDGRFDPFRQETGGQPNPLYRYKISEEEEYIIEPGK